MSTIKNRSNKVLGSLLLCIMTVNNIPTVILEASSLVGNLPTSPASFQNVSYTLKEGVTKISNLENALSQAKISEELNGETSLPGFPVSEKIKENAFIKKEVLAQTIPQYKAGMVLFDENTGMSAKIDTPADPSNAENPQYMTLQRPQMNEVLKDFKIPDQVVNLNRKNITRFAPNVESAVIAWGDEKKDALPQMLSGIFDHSQKSKAGSFKHITDPFMTMQFNDMELDAFAGDGASVKIKISGALGIDKIQVDGKYSFMDGYKFVLKTGEEMNLKIETKIKIDKELTIPLFAIDVPAGIAHARGGLYLIVGMNGNFKLVTEATQWLTVSAGIHGATLFGVPSSFKPIFSHDKGFDLDVTFLGKINGYMKLGPLLELELLGWDVAGAGALIGAGVTCEMNDDIIQADCYGTIEIYATLVGKRLNLMHTKLSLFQMQVPNTSGYDVKMREVDAYRNVIYGNIRKENDDGNLIPAKNIYLYLQRQGLPHRNIPATCDANGNFFIELSKLSPAVQLKADDKIRVSEADGVNITPAFVSPTQPFHHIEIEYADFFNDTIKGYVRPARVKNPATGAYDELIYNGNINLYVKNAAGTVKKVAKAMKDGIFVYPVSYNLNFVNPLFQSNQTLGSFSSDVGFNIQPTDTIRAEIDFNGFIVGTKGELKASADIVGQRVQNETKPETFSEEGHKIDRKTETETFYIFNTRGEKSMEGTAMHLTEYRLITPVSLLHDPITGMPLAEPKLLASKKFDVTLEKKGDGGSVSTKTFVTEFSWAEQAMVKPTSIPSPMVSLTPATPTPISSIIPTATPSPAQATPTPTPAQATPAPIQATPTPTPTPTQATPTPVPLVTLNPSIRMPNLQLQTPSPIPTPKLVIPRLNPIILPMDSFAKKVYATSTFPDSLKNVDLINQNQKLSPLLEGSPDILMDENTIRYRYNSENQYPAGGASYSNPNIPIGIHSIKRVGEITLMYEGQKIVIQDPADAQKGQKGRGLLTTGNDPLLKVLIRQYWSVVNPDPTAVFKPGDRVSNMAQVPDWSKNAVKSILDKGYLSLDSQGAFKNNASVTRGEATASIVRALRLDTLNAKNKFSDISSAYPFGAEIAVAMDKGIVKGLSATTFGPYQTITREQTAVMMMNGLKQNYGAKLIIPDDSKSFHDSGQISGWAKNAVNEITALGIMKGNADGSFSPNKLITFNEMAALLNQLDTKVARLQ